MSTPTGGQEPERRDHNYRSGAASSGGDDMMRLTMTLQALEARVTQMDAVVKDRFVHIQESRSLAYDAMDRVNQLDSTMADRWELAKDTLNHNVDWTKKLYKKSKRTSRMLQMAPRACMTTLKPRWSNCVQLNGNHLLCLRCFQI